MVVEGAGDAARQAITHLVSLCAWAARVHTRLSLRACNPNVQRAQAFTMQLSGRGDGAQGAALPSRRLAVHARPAAPAAAACWSGGGQARRAGVLMQRGGQQQRGARQRRLVAATISGDGAMTSGSSNGEAQQQLDTLLADAELEAAGAGAAVGAEQQQEQEDAAVGVARAAAPKHGRAKLIFSTVVVVVSAVANRVLYKMVRVQGMRWGGAGSGMVRGSVRPTRAPPPPLPSTSSPPPRAQALTPLSNYVFFLAQLQVFGYVAVYATLLFGRYRAGKVTPQMLRVPLEQGRLFLLIGAVEAASALLGFVGAANLPGERKLAGR